MQRLTTAIPAFTTNQCAILFLVLVLGWILGLASRSGGGKWKRRLEEERDEHALAVRRYEEEKAAARTRIADLERDLAARPTAVVAPIAGVAPVAGVSPVAGVAPFPARTDDLSLIRGIGPVGQDRLAEHGLHAYRDIRALDPVAKADLEQRVGAPAGTIDRDRWQEQAALLEEGRLDEHRRTFG